ncbi:hypothetical protein C1645_859812 [Glomus cerebriforme]|uniref:AN1-type domain-containing protein n=1 Tax=Glomus cerebriforme TaxID=658196 RepID=A0A397THN9_9GLOM|nr:hypothetical protein C1645_859812 [Glomus cerebriforme]
MEFPTVGDRCSFEGCEQLDFLPFRCGSCGKKYCLNHRYPTSHECFRWGENEKLKEHLKSNCTLHLLSSTPTATKTCFIIGCKNTSEGGVMVYVVCDGCGEVFCLKHRHPQTHQCASLNVASDEKAKRRMIAEEIISKYVKKSTSNTTNTSDDKDNTSSSSKSATTNKPKKINKKIEVMKLKSKAQGESSIPANARLYLSVDFPHDSNIHNKPMFFNKDWTVGKVLDKVATEGKIKNINNKISLDDPSRLVLFNKETKNILETNKKLNQVVENGDNISLEKYGSINN